MPLASGTRLGPYEITAQIDAGGMGVVHLARDTRLDRDVAIKELPEHFAQDPARLERFEREAKMLATLNHANLAGIHGVEEMEGAKYLVLEYVEGETLADRLDRAALPLDEALELAVQIAAGVEAAHEAGIIHRDLKPDNISEDEDQQQARLEDRHPDRLTYIQNRAADWAARIRWEVPVPTPLRSRQQPACPVGQPVESPEGGLIQPEG